MIWQGMIRRGPTWVAAFVAIVALPIAATAQSGKVVQSFTATTMGMTPGSGTSLTIDISRWSTDAECDTLLAAFAKDAGKTWAQTLQAAPAVGYIWQTDGELGYAIRYAQVLPATDGEERFLLVTDRALGSWERLPWKATVPGPVEYAFSVIEAQVNHAGQGEGKTSATSTVTVDVAAKMIQLDNYASAPALLRIAKRAQVRPAPVAAPKPSPAAK